MESYSGNIVDVVKGEIYFGRMDVEAGIIKNIEKLAAEDPKSTYWMPGFVDAHVHIESSMLVPDEFARAALKHGTLASVSDPHEIANVLGMKGIDFMLERASLTPFKTLFGAPSCVPATPFESAGAQFSAKEIQMLLETGKAGYVSEMMNYPGVINGAKDVAEKLSVAKAFNVPVDGHAPGLVGEQAKRYAQAGIATDHECTRLEEAESKIHAGMHILIREGSAARDFETLFPLIDKYPEKVMLCSDDKHPDDLMVEHIRNMVIRALEKGGNLFNVLRAATLNPVKHYQLDLGLLQEGDAFDAIEVSNLREFNVLNGFIKGKKVVENGRCLIQKQALKSINVFNARNIDESSLMLEHPGTTCRVIAAEDGKLYTRQLNMTVPEKEGFITADLKQDILFLVVLNRYKNTPPAVALIHGFGIKGSDGQGGAMASSVAHDSHNIVAVGTSAKWLVRAINRLIEHRGGLVAVDSSGEASLPLPVAGLMSDQSVEEVGPAYHNLNNKAREMGSTLSAPFMTLSFMSLLVIPELKLSDQGLFDGTRFQFCELAASEETA